MNGNYMYCRYHGSNICVVHCALYLFELCLFFRAECYKCIIDLLDDLMQAAESHPQSPSVPTKPGPPQITPASNGSTLSALYGALSPEEAQQNVSIKIGYLHYSLSTKAELVIY